MKKISYQQFHNIWHFFSGKNGLLSLEL